MMAAGMNDPTRKDAEDFFAELGQRRSVRKFRDEPVPRETLMRIIEAGTLAPSACNVQGWRFILVDQPDLRQTLMEAGGSVLIPKAPVGILVIYDNTTKNTPYRDDVQSASACIQNMLLMANNLGLGACWICNLPSPGFLRRLLRIPWNYSPVAYLILGHPAEPARKPMARRYRLDDIVGVNGFPAAGKGKTPGRFMVLALRVAYAGYRLTPRFIKKRVLNPFVDRYLTKKFDN